VRERECVCARGESCGCARSSVWLQTSVEERGARSERSERRAKALSPSRRHNALRLPTSLETWRRAMQTTHTHAHIHTYTHTNGLGWCVNGDKRLGPRVLASRSACLTYTAMPYVVLYCNQVCGALVERCVGVGDVCGVSLIGCVVCR